MLYEKEVGHQPLIDFKYDHYVATHLDSRISPGHDGTSNVSDSVRRSTFSRTVSRSPLSLENQPQRPVHFRQPTHHDLEALTIFLQGRHLSRCHHSSRYEERRRRGIESGELRSCRSSLSVSHASTTSIRVRTWLGLSCLRPFLQARSFHSRTCEPRLGN